MLLGAVFFGVKIGQSNNVGTSPGTHNTLAINTSPNSGTPLANGNSTSAVGAPTQAPTFIPSPTPSPTATPCPNPCVLYQENGSDNWSGWLASGPDWSVLNGKLINTDGKGNPLIVPYSPGANGYNDYSVVVKITRIKFISGYGGSFGIVARDDGNGGGYTFSLCSSLGYAFGTTWGCNNDYNTYSKAELLLGQQFPDGGSLKAEPFLSTKGSEYTYRIDVKGGTITVYINGNPILGAVTDLTYLSGGQVSIWDSGCQLSISSVEIMAI